LKKIEFNISRHSLIADIPLAVKVLKETKPSTALSPIELFDKYRSYLYSIWLLLNVFVLRKSSVIIGEHRKR
ncbi:hypothetical protein LAJ55_13370, partial [Streptococcus pneumoniae]|uniref:hypothetical protein n=2 Tax=Streptococcus pneumoniae TaxID=1313 RepID=UPI001CC11B6A